MKRKELICKLNDIEYALNDVMLEESWIGTALPALSKWLANHQKTSNLFKLCFTGISTTLGANMATLPKWAYTISSTIKVSLLGILGYNATFRKSHYKNKYQMVKHTLSANICSIEEVKKEAMKGSSSLIDSKKEGLLEKIWNTFTSQMEKIRNAIAGGVKVITDSIGTVPFLVLGFGAALMAIMASIVVYYIQVGGNINSSIKSAFEDAFSGIKAANGIEAMVNLFLVPAKLCFNFVKQSPFAALLFGFGLCIAFAMLVAGIAGWDVLFPQEEISNSKLPESNKESVRKETSSGKGVPPVTQSNGKAKMNSK